MELAQARYFVVLAEHLNFTKAARMCMVTQPALTKAIQKLEAELGGALIYREHRLTQLTELGRLVLPKLQKMLSTADEAGSLARGFKKSESSKLKIGFAPSVSLRALGVLLNRYRQNLPDVDIELVEISAPDPSKGLLQSDFGAGIVGYAEDLSERIDRWALFSERFHVVLSAESPLTQLRSISAEILRSQILVVRDDRAVHNYLQQKIGNRCHQWITYKGTQESQLYELVGAGLAITLGSEYAPLPSNVVSRPLDDESFRRSVSLVAVAGRRYSAALQSFVRLARSFDWPSYLGASLISSSKVPVARKRAK